MRKDCPVCKGAGFVHPLLASGRPDFSRVVPCNCTRQELAGEKVEQLRRQSNLGVLARLTFENLVPTGRVSGEDAQRQFRASYDAAVAFANNPEGWLILIGPTGCGKTHLACAIANEVINRGRPVFYIGVADLLDHLRYTFNPSSEITHDEFFERVKKSPLLVLDDLNVSGATPWARGKLEQLLDYRFNVRLPTVITTSVSLEDLDDSLRWRLSDPQFCRICVVRRQFPSILEEFSELQLRMLKEKTFENFDYKLLYLQPKERQSLEQAYRCALNFAKCPEGWLVLMGVNGCGKTHLAAAIANYLRAEGRQVLFIVVPELLDHLRSAFSPESRVHYDELFEVVKKSPVLILDDFGEQSATPWAQEKLYQLINYRYNARLATVITTCLSLDEIESRISSRMVDPAIGLVLNIDAPDYRGDTRSHHSRKRGQQQRYSRRSNTT